MKAVRGYHLLFALSLAALTALGAWWTVFFVRSVEVERKASLGNLVHATAVTALRLGHGREPPEIGLLPGPVPLEVVPSEQFVKGEIFAPAVPNFPGLGVRPLEEIVRSIHERVRRRRIMLIGEGALLFILLGVCTFMLYRLVRVERHNMRRMEAFVASVSHEMKTPLTGMKSLLQTFAAGKVPEQERDRLYAMGLKEAERLEHMVENVLLSGRLRDGRLQVHAEPVELRPLLEGFVEHRRRYLIDRPESIRLVWDSRSPGLVVLADPNALNLVLENLADNAFKYGGPSPLVTVRVHGRGEQVLLSVEDQGVGFSPERSEELFVPFRRALDLKSSGQHGTGLGLAIARALVQRMNGRLSAESEGPGKGSRFTVSLREART